MFQVLPQCLSPESPLPSVLLTVKLLSLLADHEKLAPQLCSRSGKARQGVGGWAAAAGWKQGRWQGQVRALLRASAACARGSG